MDKHATTLAAQARAIAREIQAFDRQCVAAEYTDTGDAWRILYRARDSLRRLAEELGKPERKA